MNYSIIDDQEKTHLRQRFIDRFVDTSKPPYQERIESRVATGLCYTGYLWECLKDNESYRYSCSMDGALSSLTAKGNVLVMWDIYSLKRVQHRCVLTDRHPMDSVIRADASELCGIIACEWDTKNRDDLWLPEDIYIFDDSMSWAIIFTHEWWDHSVKQDSNDIARICFVIE